jgi:DNA helicase-2/ATP-dependent DNA helicase PcrA
MSNRVFYVAITRAKEKLFLTYALSRYRFGRLKSCEPSRFIDEIDEKFIKASAKHGGGARTKPVVSSSNYAKNLVSSTKSTQPTRSKPVPAHKLSAGFEPSDTSSLEEGMKVEHSKFGYGKVASLENNGANRKAKVNFDNFGEKTLLLSFAKLKIHQ